MNDKITLEQIEQARDHCAFIIAYQGAKYLPIFERLEKEIIIRKKQDRLLKKALQIGTHNEPQNEIHFKV